MKLKSTRTEDGAIKFDHYKAVKKSDHYFAVYDISGTEITSADTMSKAAVKAKLLEIGYHQAMEIYREW